MIATISTFDSDGGVSTISQTGDGNGAEIYIDSSFNTEADIAQDGSINLATIDIYEFSDGSSASIDSGTAQAM